MRRDTTSPLARNFVNTCVILLRTTKQPLNKMSGNTIGKSATPKPVFVEQPSSFISSKARAKAGSAATARKKVIPVEPVQSARKRLSTTLSAL